MEPFASPAAPIRSALFVDFDNIFIGLSKSDQQAAERFASDPARWLNWLERGLPGRADGKDGPPRERSILVRRCYPNPDAGFRRFRSFFTSAAFAVTDCPTLTRTGKNSSDIYMVMDILDLLNHKTYFDEFIIFSGDSDFMPVLLRLRAHDRRTTTLAIDFMPPAYKAACDLVISEEEFIEDALGISHDNGCGSQRGRVSMNTVKEMAIRVYDAACTSGEVAGADLPEILKDFREFRDSNNWLGYGTSQRLAEALTCSETRLTLVRINATMYKLVVKPTFVKMEPADKPHPADKTRPAEKSQPLPVPAPPAVERPVPVVDRFQPAPEKVYPVADRFQPLRKDRPSERQQAEKSQPAEIRQVEREKRPTPARPGAGRGERDAAPTAEKPGRLEPARLRERIIAIVREIVAASQTPVLLARVSQQVVNRLGQQVLESQWAGAGSFKRLLQGTADLGLEISTQPEPGYIYDAQRHSAPQPRPRSAAEPASGEAQAAEGETAQPQESAPEQMQPQDQPSATMESAAEGTAAMESEQVEATSSESEPERVSEPAPAAPLMELFHGDENSEDMEEPIEGAEEEELEEEESEDYGEQTPTSLEELARRVSRVTGVPDLTSEEYALVFRGIVNELQQIARGDKTYSTYQSSKAVSDWCAERGVPISRSDIVLIFKGIIFQDGVRFGKQPGSYTERDLAFVVCTNVRALCKRARLELNGYEDHLLELWITGGLDTLEEKTADAGHGAEPVVADQDAPVGEKPEEPQVESNPVAVEEPAPVEQVVPAEEDASKAGDAPQAEQEAPQDEDLSNAVDGAKVEDATAVSESPAAPDTDVSQQEPTAGEDSAPRES